MEVTRHFLDDALANLDTNDVLAVREVNDQLMQLERHLYRSTPTDVFRDQSSIYSLYIVLSVFCIYVLM